MTSQNGLLKEAGSPAATVTYVAKRGILQDVRRSRTLILMTLPALIYFLIFSYLPMGGVYLAFTRFNFEGGLFGSPFVGLDNFRFLWQSGTLLNITKNTIMYNLVFILLANVLQMFCAIVLCELSGRVFKKVTQSIMFLPHFISYVLVGAFVYNLLNVDNGVLNSMLKQFGMEPFNFYGESGPWHFIIPAVYLWKNIGYGTVVYLAAVMGISEEYYEAAKIDGANVFQQIRNITLPLLMPSFVLLILFAIGGILKGQFDLFYQLVGTNGNLYDATDIIDTYVFRALMVNFDIGMGSAAGLFQSAFGFLLVMAVNLVVKKTHEDYALF